jgi:hypothetical protein
MFTSAECRAHAEQKLEQAEHDQQHRRRLITAAEAWLNLASLLRRTEARLSQPKTTTRKDRPPAAAARPAELHDL